ncbi:MAG: SDR family NAD(P)-dependent oxidoreductase [Acidobacteria bacterium]|nr:SDR family NAD(P)-dependent oxidoreductase [Acidobacteriota bacterium]
MSEINERANWGESSDSLVGSTADDRKPAYEPIAVVGIGCRFPGKSNGPEAFWQLLSNGVDAVREVPPDRWKVKSFYDPEPGTPGKSYSRWGGFIEGIDQFDANFFGISPREAACMDPQQRILLEVAYEAIENAGQSLDGMAGSSTGVFIGISTNDYAQIQSTIEDRDAIETYTTTGGVMSITANRISYSFDLRGPSLAVDTACSSSLVAVHLACTSIWNRESKMALAGGVNVIICPEPFIGFSKLAMLSPEGRCKAFDASGDGFVRGEGAGIVFLKPLSRALADRDTIYALIRGTAVTQDGRTNGITVPSEVAQAAMLREACRRAGVRPEKIQYVEAHGTGTAVGDPIETNALGAILAENRADGSYCAIGSVKANVGHLEAGAGMAGLIKVALSLKHGLIPASLHLKDPNPLIHFDKLKLRVQERLGPFLQNGEPVFAGVNSFGFGGTNAHILLSDAPREAALPGEREQRSADKEHLLPLSARSLEALKSLAQSHVDLLTGQNNGAELTLMEDLGHNLGVRRTHHDHRLALVVQGKEGLLDTLNAFIAGENRPGWRYGHSAARSAPKLAFVYSGQGPQWWGMGRELIEREPVFRKAIEECAALLPAGATWSLMEELTADEARSRLHETSIGQPAIFALQVGLTALWRSWGVEPDAVVGHSVGEVAAAYVAGVLNLEDAVRVIFHRGRCMDLASSKGRMLGVGVPLEQAQELIVGYEKVVSVAAVNSPVSVTLSGEPEALEEIHHSLDEQRIYASYLRVNYAFHSPQMDPVRDELLASLGDLKPNRADKPIFSTVTGRLAESSEFDAAYWWHNVRRQVRFAPAIDALIEAGHHVFLELSPHPVLASAVTECLQTRQQPGLVIPSLRRKTNERHQTLTSLGALYTWGVGVNWKGLYPDSGSRLKLPRYPWQHESYWHEAEGARAARLGVEVHPLLGRRLNSADPSWRVEISRGAFPYLQDHRVQGHVVFPAAAYVEMAFAAARETWGPGTYVVEDIDFQKALFIPENAEAPILQTTFYPEDSSFRIYSRLKKSDKQWTLHTSGKIRCEPEISINADRRIDRASIQRDCPEEITKAVCYQKIKDRGLHFGAAFQGIDWVWRRDGEALAEVSAPELLRADEEEDYLIHPAVLDSCLQVISESISSTGPDSDTEVYLPVRISQVRFFGRPGNRIWSHARLLKKTAKSLEADIELLDQAGNLLVEIRGLKAQSVDTVRDASAESLDNWIYEFRWQLKPRSEVKTSLQRVDFLPGEVEMEVRLRADAERLSDELGWKQRFRGVQPELNQLCSAYIVRALGDLGWDPVVANQVTVESLARELGVVPRHHRLLGRFLDLLAFDGWLAKTGEGWTVRRTLAGANTEGIWKSVLHRFPALYPELMLTVSCGERLADVLQGKVDALQLIFPGGSTTIAEHLYQDAPSFRIYNLLVAQAVSNSLESLPEGRRVRLLEIGGGTAAMTSYVVPRLPADQVEYVFTDISPHFLLEAEQKFREHPFIKYQPLDIEKDPAEQGFELHSFDFILASDVLHATSDLRRSIRNVQQLLASGGSLILLETDNPARWVDLVFGLTQGWWMFRDTDLRPSSPLLSRERWLEVLAEEGFSHPFAVSETDSKEEASQVVLLARGPVLEQTDISSGYESAERNAEDSERRWLILADKGGTGRAVADHLRTLGHEAILVDESAGYRRIDDEHFQVRADEPEDFQRMLREVSLAGEPGVSGIIHCWSLDGGPTDDATPDSLLRSTVLGCHSVMHLIQAWSQVSEMGAPELWLITRGAQPVGDSGRTVSIEQAPLCGLARVIINEHQEFRCRMIDLADPTSRIEIQSLLDELLHGDIEDEVALRGSGRFVQRLTRTSLSKFSKDEMKSVPLDQTAARLETSAPGVLDNLTLRQSNRRYPGPGEVEIQVAAAALNFRDVMKALGIYPTDSDEDMLLGDECAGTIVAVGPGVDDLRVGDQVIAIGPGSFGSFVTTKAAFAVPKPPRFSFDEAVTIPIAFLTAHYALHHLGRISKGDRVLIQAATGGVGLAAVQIAQHVGAEVFATAGTPEKRAFLKSMGVQHVMDSRSLAFADEILQITGGRGVDMVLNSLSGDAIARGLACLAPYGRFLEIGKRDIYQNSKLGLRIFKSNLSFFAIDLSRVMSERPELICSQLRELMQQFELGYLNPLPYRLFSIGQVVSAFRYMAQSKHIGKIVIAFQHQHALVEPLLDQAVEFSSDATYLITGGLGGFGLAVAEWMVSRGARHLVLLGRSGAASDEALLAISGMESLGAQIVVAKADVTREADVARALADIRRSLPPLRGVIHAAMVLDDGVLLQLNRDRFRRVIEPKVLGAWNLHRMTADVPLDFFVLFSSVTTMAGNPGQANYVAANSFLDAFAHYRRKKGLPALTINWGHVSDVGYVARHRAVSEHLEDIGLKGFTSKQAMTVMERLLLKKPAQVGVMNVDWRQWAKFASANASPRLSLLMSPEALDAQSGDEFGRFRDVIIAAQPVKRQEIIESYLIDQVARVLGTSTSKLELDRPLNEMGLDSLMTVELKNRIEKEIGISLPTVELMRGPSISKLSRVLQDQLAGTDSAPRKPPKAQIPITIDGGKKTAAAGSLLEGIDELSDQEVDSLLSTLVDQNPLNNMISEKGEL